MRSWSIRIVFVWFGLSSAAVMSADNRDASWLLPVPELVANPTTPTLKQIVGHAWGEDVTSYAEIERYLQALVAAEPARTRLERYARTSEGRWLYYLVISSPANIARIESIRANQLRLADPRGTSPEEARELIADSPAVVWLAYGVHGNETSGCDAALLTAYHLLADQSAKGRELLEQLVVIIDPMENPDGRERFISVYRETRGVFPQSEPFASEHVERWPGGRFNHYLFDMNRDWFLQSQAESQGRVAAYLKWHPQIYVDAHEMGRDAHYYFDPPMDPVNELTLPRQREWFYRLGKHQAARFDQYGFAFTTREMFDAFYPGYGSTWPTMHGGIGILWEQAGVRGKVIDRSDETKLRYDDAVRHHYVSGLATIEVAVEHRRELLHDFYQARADGIRLGQEGPIRDYFLLAGKSPHRASRLVRLLVQNGIEVRVVGSALAARTTSVLDGGTRERTIPSGSFHVPLAQPASRLARILLDRHAEMGTDFVKRQIDRLERRLPDEIYDVTAWSLPLAFGVECLATHAATTVVGESLESTGKESDAALPRAKVAYLVPGEDDGAPFALCRWLEAGLRVHVADQPLKLGGVAFAKGSLILKVHENPPNLHEHVAEAVRHLGFKVHATDTGFVDEGAHLGGPDVRWVKPPRVALLVDRPASYTVGHTWYLFDQMWKIPVTRVAGRSLANLDLAKYNVLILPDGNYSDADAPNEALVAKMKEWVRAGGTLILVKGAAAWGAGDRVRLLANKTVRKPQSDDSKSPAKTAAASKASSDATTSTASEKAEGEPPDAVPGAFLRASVYDDHWVTFGMGSTTDVLMNGNLILAPLKPAEGRNLVSFVANDRLLTSGFCWPDTLQLLAGTPYVLHQALGAGHIIAFTDDPNFRAMYPETQRLFLNSVLFGPGH